MMNKLLTATLLASLAVPALAQDADPALVAQARALSTPRSEDRDNRRGPVQSSGAEPANDHTVAKTPPARR